MRLGVLMSIIRGAFQSYSHVDRMIPFLISALMLTGASRGHWNLTGLLRLVPYS